MHDPATDTPTRADRPLAPRSGAIGLATTAARRPGIRPQPRGNPLPMIVTGNGADAERKDLT